MVLIIDVGNTCLKWALLDVSALLAWDVAQTPTAPWARSGSLAHHELAELSSALSDVVLTDCLISNVAAHQVQVELEIILRTLAPDLPITKFVSSPSCAGLTNRYLEPHKLGSDRFASAIAAHSLFPECALVVATCGTATTIDVVTVNGEFAGGMIAPGLQVMAASLAKNTAQLPDIADLIKNEAVHEVFARSTELAIASGCLHAQVGAILSALLTLKASEAKSPVQLVISGGAAPYILPLLAPHLQGLHFQWQHVANLVLTGLAIVAKSNSLCFTDRFDDRP
ncbi:MAG: type III pantothenate kinase [Burkholderiales bacterium]|nr:type III pantothenate kinase [Burkholderiales bacterium]